MERSRARLVLTLAPAAYAFVMAAASCTTFGAEPAVADASSDGSGSDGPIDPDANPGDGAPQDDGGERPSLEPVCPASPSGNDRPTAWKKRKLFSPMSVAMFPFAIATDATHVTWIAQVATSADSNPYDGAGAGQILRAPKDGSGNAVTLAADQRLARALALDGVFAYWVTYGLDNIAALMRTPRECVGSCPEPERVMTFPSGNPITRLARAAPGILFATSYYGRLFHIDVTALNPTQVYMTDAIAGLAVTPSSAFVSAKEWPVVGAAPTDGGSGADLLTIAADDAGPKGVVPIATDCNSLWMVRGYSGAPQLLGYKLSGPTATTSLQSRLPVGPFDLAADATWLYFAAPNAGGVFVVDKSTGESTLLESGNVWTIAVDRDGVYYGEHDKINDTGSLYMLVKH